MVSPRAEITKLLAALEAVCSNDKNINSTALLRKEVEQLKMQPSCDREAETAQLWSQMVRKGKGRVMRNNGMGKEKGKEN